MGQGRHLSSPAIATAVALGARYKNQITRIYCKSTVYKHVTLLRERLINCYLTFSRRLMASAIKIGKLSHASNTFFVRLLLQEQTFHTPLMHQEQQVSETIISPNYGSYSCGRCLRSAGVVGFVGPRWSWHKKRTMDSKTTVGVTPRSLELQC